MQQLVQLRLLAWQAWQLKKWLVLLPLRFTPAGAAAIRQHVLLVMMCAAVTRLHGTAAAAGASCRCQACISSDGVGTLPTSTLAVQQQQQLFLHCDRLSTLMLSLKLGSPLLLCFCLQACCMLAACG
jgi:hypothetical protein